MAISSPSAGETPSEKAEQRRKWERKMFRQQFMVDPPAEEDVFRILTFIFTGLSLYFYKVVKNDCNLLLNPGIHRK